MQHVPVQSSAVIRECRHPGILAVHSIAPSDKPCLHISATVVRRMTLWVKHARRTEDANQLMGPHRPFFGIQEAYRPLLLPDQLVAERARNLGQLGDEPEVAETDHGGTKGVEQPPEPVVLGFVAPIAMCGSVGGSVGTSAVQSGMDVVQRSSFTLTNRLHASGHAGSVPYLGMSLKCTFIYMGRDSNDFVGCVRFQHHPQ